MQDCDLASALVPERLCMLHAVLPLVVLLLIVLRKFVFV